MYSIVYLPDVQRQLTDAALYIAEQLASPDAAEKLLNTVDVTVKSLTEMPYRYPIYPALHTMKKEIRYVPVMNYLLFYTIQEEQKTVEVWRFLH